MTHLTSGNFFQEAERSELPVFMLRGAGLARLSQQPSSLWPSSTAHA